MSPSRHRSRRRPPDLPPRHRRAEAARSLVVPRPRDPRAHCTGPVLIPYAVTRSRARRGYDIILIHGVRSCERFGDIPD